VHSRKLLRLLALPPRRTSFLSARCLYENRSLSLAAIDSQVYH
jgi:hypothetical protein